MLWTAGQDGRVCVWDLASDVCTVLSGHKGTVRAIAFDPKTRTLFTAGDDMALVTWPIRPLSRSQ